MATDTSTQDKPKDLLVQDQDDGSAVITDPNEPAVKVPEEDEDDAPAERTGTAADADVDDVPTEQEELQAARTDEDRAAIQVRRRKERAERKQKAHDREDRLRRENAQQAQVITELRERVGKIEQRTTGADLAQLDNAIRSAAAEADHYSQLQAEAINQSNGAAAAEATKKMMAASQKALQLTEVRRNVSAAPAQRAAPTAPDPRVISKAQNWADRNPWYDPSGKDTDSRVTLMLDQELAQAGYQPSTDEYWAELESRVKKYLPHRVARAGGAENGGTIPGTDARKPSRSVVTGSGRETGSTAGAGTFTLSAERVKALKDAGYWDDPAARNDMIKRYREADRASKAK